MAPGYTSALDALSVYTLCDMSYIILYTIYLILYFMRYALYYTLCEKSYIILYTICLILYFMRYALYYTLYDIFLLITDYRDFRSNSALAANQSTSIFSSRFPLSASAAKQEHQNRNTQCISSQQCATLHTS